jgi:hypothetical protein
MSRRLTIPILTGMILLCFYAASYRFLLQHRSETKQVESANFGIWNLPPMALLAIAGEFKGLMADYLTMDSVPNLFASRKEDSRSSRKNMTGQD